MFLVDESGEIGAMRREVFSRLFTQPRGRWVRTTGLALGIGMVGTMVVGTALATPGHAAPRGFAIPATSPTNTPPATPTPTETDRCDIQNVGYTFAPGTQLTIVVSTVYNGGNGLTGSGMSYTVSFTGGPAPVKETAQTDGNQQITVPAPSQDGNYQISCTYNGDASGQYAPSTSGTLPVTISAQNALGGVQLYTSPTTYNPYQSAEMYVVFQAAPGGPTPTGVFNIDFGTDSSREIQIGSDGTALVQLDPQGGPGGGGGSSIDIDYHGDPYYTYGTSHFPLTNPPIPSTSSNTGSGATGGSTGAQATATPKATPAPTATETPSTATSGASVGVGGRNGGNSSGGNGSALLWVIVAILIVVLLGSLTPLAMVYLNRRKRPAISSPSNSTPPSTGSPFGTPNTGYAPTKGNAGYTPYPPYPTRPPDPPADGDAPTWPGNRP